MDCYVHNHKISQCAMPEIRMTLYWRSTRVEEGLQNHFEKIVERFFDQQATTMQDFAVDISPTLKDFLLYSTMYDNKCGSMLCKQQ